VTTPCSVMHHTIKAYGGTEVQLHACLTLATYGDEWFDSHPGRFTPGDIFPHRRLFGLWSLSERFRDEELLAPARSRNATPLSPHSLCSMSGTTLKRTQQHTARTRINGLDSTDSRHMLPLEHNNQYLSASQGS
jgi:hypothetical protein